MLFWTAVINGVVAVPIMVAMMLLVMNRRVGTDGRAAALAIDPRLARHRADGAGGRAADLVEHTLNRARQRLRPDGSCIISNWIC